MFRIDAHQHFWQFDPERDSWMGDDMKVLQQDFMPAQLQPLLQESGMDGCVAVQADQSEEESDFLLKLAANFDFIKGVVGWVDLKDEVLEKRLDAYSRFPKMKGFRHILQSEPDDAFMLQPQFQKGISLLHPYHFTYDLLVYPKHLKNVLKLVTLFPHQMFVIDHLAKPNIRMGKIKEWADDMRRIAHQPNVYCKVSGMVTEGDWKYWKKEDFDPYLDTIVQAFGTHRLMYGSDWPVCLVAATYKQQLSIVQKYFETFSASEQAQIFGGNAVQFYHL